MARYRHYDPHQTKMIAVSYGRQLLPGTFVHALSCLIDNEIDRGRFAARFKNDETGAPAYAQQDRLRKCRLIIVAARKALTRITQQRGKHDDQQRPKSSGQKRHAPGVDGKSLTELLEVTPTPRG